MSPKLAFLWLVAINVLLVVGDLFSKRAVALPQRDPIQTAIALGIWFAACCLWLPVMRARGFTKLVALADAMGLVMLAIVGHLFLDEHLSIREVVGVGFSIAAVLLLAGG